MNNAGNQKSNANTIYNQVWWAHAVACVTILIIQNYREYGTNTSFFNLILIIWCYCAVAYIVKNISNDVLTTRPSLYLLSSLLGFICLALPISVVGYLIWAAITFKPY